MTEFVDSDTTDQFKTSESYFGISFINLSPEVGGRLDAYVRGQREANHRLFYETIFGTYSEKDSRMTIEGTASAISYSELALDALQTALYVSHELPLADNHDAA